MTRRGFLLVPALAVLFGCNVAEDPFAERAGLWETTTQLISIEDPSMSPRGLAEYRTAGAKIDTQRVCLGPRGGVGEPALGGDCTATRIDDEGTKVDREALCPANGERKRQIVTTRGTRARESYDYRVTIEEPALVGKGAVIVARERGRRVGDCPAKS